MSAKVWHGAQVPDLKGFLLWHGLQGVWHRSCRYDMDVIPDLKYLLLLWFQCHSSVSFETESNEIR